MKFIIIIIIIIFIQSANAEETTVCDLEISNQAVQLAEMFDQKPQACLVGVKQHVLDTSFGPLGKTESICDECNSPTLIENGNEKLKQRIPNPEYKNKFLKATYNELRKGLSQLMLDLISLRSTPGIELDGEGIAANCKLSEISNFPLVIRYLV